ncbi:MAG: DUF2791 family P-loop domain-containing protein [Acidobacteria bacterium]|nr:DUF2791 family P-loop domain-containing protein [Acidobacteriota bacterium]MCW5969386.1 DUF2791 family P-loop domain-containing protein [Blastocatellales bacterium]
MIGSIVNHPLFGRGLVTELRKARRDAAVHFDNGIRAVVPVSILSVLRPGEELAPSPQPAAPIPPRTPEQESRFAARRTIEALRYGIVPHQRIRDLSAGLEAERTSLERAFEEVERSGGEVRVILGEYGAGKSHFFELAAQEALSHNFLVATTNLDLREVPPNRPQRIYNALIRNLRYPDAHGAEEGGSLAMLFDRVLGRPAVYAQVIERLGGSIFHSALHNYELMRSEPGEALDLLLDWIAGEKVFITAVRAAAAAPHKEFPIRALSQMTTAADQYCHLLSGWGWIARQAGYAGLAVLLDESEHYSLLNVRGQERADNFFKGLIYTALAARPDCRIKAGQLAHHHLHAHSFLAAERSDLLVMFAVTPSASTFDYRRWLDDDQIVPLQHKLSAGALTDLLGRLQAMHEQAYGYERRVGIEEISSGLRACLDGELINLRQTIRLATQIYDLCYAHPDYPALHAIAELRGAMFGET